MKIAYIILAHKLPEQLVRLVEKLNSENSIFLIHVDKKTDRATYMKMVEPLSKFHNVQFTRRYVCYWGRFGHLKATLTGLETLILNKIPFDYAILLTGQCYPIKTNEQIEIALQENIGLSFINYFPVPDPQDENWAKRFSYWHIFLGKYHFVFPRENMFSNRIMKTLWNPIARNISLRRSTPCGFEPFHGWAYWCLHSECINYIVNFVHDNKFFVNYFKYVMFPDEFFFQTVIINSKFKEFIVNDDLRYIHFPKGKGHPIILRKEDMPEFMNSTDLFARKFDVSVDSNVLDLIDQYLIDFSQKIS